MGGVVAANGDDFSSDAKEFLVCRIGRRHFRGFRDSGSTCKYNISTRESCSYVDLGIHIQENVCIGREG